MERKKKNKIWIKVDCSATEGSLIALHTRLIPMQTRYLIWFSWIDWECSRHRKVTCRTARRTESLPSTTRPPPLLRTDYRWSPVWASVLGLEGGCVRACVRRVCEGRREGKCLRKGVWGKEGMCVRKGVWGDEGVWVLGRERERVTACVMRCIGKTVWCDVIWYGVQVWESHIWCVIQWPAVKWLWWARLPAKISNGTSSVVTQSTATNLRIILYGHRFLSWIDQKSSNLCSYRMAVTLQCIKYIIGYSPQVLRSSGCHRTSSRSLHHALHWIIQNRLTWYCCHYLAANSAGEEE